MDTNAILNAAAEAAKTAEAQQQNQAAAEQQQAEGNEGELVITKAELDAAINKLSEELGTELGQALVVALQQIQLQQKTAEAAAPAATTSSSSSSSSSKDRDWKDTAKSIGLLGLSGVCGFALGRGTDIGPDFDLPFGHHDMW